MASNHLRGSVRGGLRGAEGQNDPATAFAATAVPEVRVHRRVGVVVRALEPRAEE